MKRFLASGLVAAMMALSFPAPSHATTSARVVAEYDFYVGGLHIAEVSLDATADGANYRARSSAVTRGVLDILLRGRSSSEARGRLNRTGHLMPVDFNTLYSSRRGKQQISIAYENANPSRVMLDPAVEADATQAGPRDRLGSLDPLSAAVAALVPSRSMQLCNRSIPIYDGKRRFDILFMPPDTARFGDSAPVPDWPKPLTRCLGIYERISGFEGMDPDKQRYYPFDIWFEDSGNGVFRAVRVAGSTKLGFAIGNLRQ